MPTVAELEAQLVPLASQVAKVKAVIRLAHDKQPVPLDLIVAVKVLTEAGHVRFSTRANRLMLTESGAKFYRQMRKFG